MSVEYTIGHTSEPEAEAVPIEPAGTVEPEAVPVGLAGVVEPEAEEEEAADDEPEAEDDDEAPLPASMEK